ncbi:DNA-3-methyladenine glycosylase I [Marinobacter sp.]|uniref:DNA-3-methyladenine glycosylase I n=1 Tax=Marinobacter sp. TaxID=50741 RepID=UPI003A919207
MRFSDIHERAIARKGGLANLNALLPNMPPLSELEARTDDRYLSEITRCVFKAGFVWRVIDNKWRGFEAAFHGFVPAYWQQVSPDVLEELASDERIVRNMQKIRTVPENARMIMDAVHQYGSFGAFLKQWPSDDQIGLLLWLKRHGSRLGGNSAQYFLRRVGWDGFILSGEVMAVLRHAELLDASPSSKKGLQQAQAAFNNWHQETGMPYSHLSRIASCSVES